MLSGPERRVLLDVRRRRFRLTEWESPSSTCLRHSGWQANSRTRSSQRGWLGVGDVLVVDANVLIHAVNQDSRAHPTARDWLHQALAGGEAVAFAWTVVLAFLRLSTHPAVFPRPLSAAEAADAVERWLQAPPALTIEPTRRHLPLLRGLLQGAGTAGNLVGDAHLAALALEHGATVVSFDRDFARFEGVALHHPG